MARLNTDATSEFRSLGCIFPNTSSRPLICLWPSCHFDLGDRDKNEPDTFRNTRMVWDQSQLKLQILNIGIADLSIEHAITFIPIVALSRFCASSSKGASSSCTGRKLNYPKRRRNCWSHEILFVVYKRFLPSKPTFCTPFIRQNGRCE